MWHSLPLRQTCSRCPYSIWNRARGVSLLEILLVVVDVAGGGVGLRGHDHEHRGGFEVNQFAPHARGHQYALAGVVHPDAAVAPPIVDHHREGPAHGHHQFGTRAVGMPPASRLGGHVVNPEDALDGEGHHAAGLGKGQPAALVAGAGYAYEAAALGPLAPSFLPLLVHVPTKLVKNSD